MVKELEEHHVFHDIKNTVAYHQAKAMEKEIIINSREDGLLWGIRSTNNFYANEIIDSEQYYNKTYKNTEQ